jgi:hypothetical protein
MGTAVPFGAVGLMGRLLFKSRVIFLGVFGGGSRQDLDFGFVGDCT